MDCPKCGHEMMNYGVENCCATCGTTSCGHEVDISRAEYNRLLAVEGEYQRVSALVRGICESAMKAVGSDSYEVQRLRAAVKQIAELMPAAIARAKGEGK